MCKSAVEWMFLRFSSWLGFILLWGTFLVVVFCFLHGVSLHFRLFPASVSSWKQSEQFSLWLCIRQKREGDLFLVRLLLSRLQIDKLALAAFLSVWTKATFFSIEVTYIYLFIKTWNIAINKYSHQAPLAVDESLQVLLGKSLGCFSHSSWQMLSNSFRLDWEHHWPAD